MLRRFGLRRLLPLLQLAIFIALVALGVSERRHDFQQQRLHPVAFQELQALPPFEPPAPAHFPTAWMIAITLNVPATILGALVAEIAHVGTNLGALICSTPFVLILWHFIGRWLDRQLGFLPMKPPGNRARVLCAGGLGLAIVLFVMGVVALRSHGQMTAETLPLGLGWLVWSLILFTMCLFTLQRKGVRRPSLVVEAPPQRATK
jgi:hypothetical protein